MTVREALLLWFGLIKNIALDLERKAESPKVTALLKTKEMVLGSGTVGEVATQLHFLTKKNQYAFQYLY